MARKPKIKTIDLHTKEWWDKVNGNTYFAALLTINFGMPTEKQFKIPYQYGYGSHSEYVAKDLINKEYKKDYKALWYAKDDGIIVRVFRKENCKQSELKNI